MELKEIVSSKPGSDYLWRKYSYGRGENPIDLYRGRFIEHINDSCSQHSKIPDPDSIS